MAREATWSANVLVSCNMDAPSYSQVGVAYYIDIPL
jgi:hypothetical protein